MLRSPAGRGERLLNRGWTASSTDAPAIRNGTTRWNVWAGASSRIAAPAAPPNAVTVPNRRMRPPWPVSSGREPAAAPAPVSTSDTVLVTFAASGGRPSASSTG
jgi:hypothetical protein